MLLKNIGVIVIIVEGLLEFEMLTGKVSADFYEAMHRNNFTDVTILCIVIMALVAAARKFFFILLFYRLKFYVHQVLV